jgi:diguanylate cyclase (GGDEF)-like protein/PAS domain S-box-containing protein
MLESGAIAEIALIFASGNDFDAQMGSALSIIGTRFGISRAYLFIDSDNGTETSNTHEWCAPGVEPQIDNLKNIPYTSIASWKRLLDRMPFFATSDIKSLETDIRAILEPQGIKSCIVAPLIVDGRHAGFFGFDECARNREWSIAEIETIKTITSVISSSYSRTLLARKLSASEENFRTLFDTLDDVLLITDLEGNLLYANAGAARKLGWSQDEIRTMKVLELHPEDKREEAAGILAAMLRKERTTCPLELRSKSGARIPVETRVWLGSWDGKPCIFGVSKDLSAEQEALQKFERLFNGNPAPMAVSDLETKKIVEVNESFLEKFGYERKDVVGFSSADLDLFADRAIWRTIRDEILSTGSVRSHELTLKRKDGGLIYGLLSGEIVQSQGKKYLLTVMSDITEEVTLKRALEGEHRRLANVIESSRLGTWEWNVQTGETAFNERWAEIIGYGLSELAPVSIETWERFAHPDDLAESGRLLEAHFRGETPFYEIESRMRHKNGGWVWVLDRGKVIEWQADGKPLRMFGSHADITETKALQAKVAELAIRDPLTELYNRRFVFDRLKTIVLEYARSRRDFSVAILDLDHFKSVNDAWGHQAGDFILKEFAAIVATSARQYDVVGRYGGEEFIVLAPGAAAPDMKAYLDRVLETVRARVFEWKEGPIRLTFSAGLATATEFTATELTVEAIVALADTRLYGAKESGRNRVVGP